MPRDPDPLTLRLFVAACETGSLAGAATRESMVPSAASKRIAALEARLGLPLLARGRRGIEPTAAGEALLRQAREVLGALGRLHAELDGFGGGVQGSVRIAASVSALAEDLPDDVAAFLERHPSVRVSLDERPSERVVAEVALGGADVGVAWDAVGARGLRARPYRSDHLCVVTPPDHPLASARSIRFADTFGHPSVSVAPGGLVDMLMQRQAALLGHVLAHRMLVSSLDAAVRIVAAGLGLVILPGEAAAVQVAASRTVMRPLDEPWAERRFVVLTRDEAATPPAARLLTEHLGRAAVAGPRATQNISLR